MDKGSIVSEPLIEMIALISLILSEPGFGGIFRMDRILLPGGHVLTAACLLGVNPNL